MCMFIGLLNFIKKRMMEMNKKDLSGWALFGAIAFMVFMIGITFGFHLVLMPYLLMVVLGVFGTELAFFPCLAIWVVSITLIHLMKSKKGDFQ